jgi:hypothetical protein
VRHRWVRLEAPLFRIFRALDNLCVAKNQNGDNSRVLWYRFFFPSSTEQILFSVKVMLVYMSERWNHPSFIFLHHGFILQVMSIYKIATMVSIHAVTLQGTISRGLLSSS